MIEDLSHLVPEIKKVFPQLEHLRNFHGAVEFGIESSYGIAWFSYCEMPEKASNYIDALIKTGGIVRSER